MTPDPLSMARSRFADTLAIVGKEGAHLLYSLSRLGEEKIDRSWVERLDCDAELAERLEAFVSRFGRMQDTMGEKLLPRWLEAQGETPGSMIDVLRRAERLGLVEDAALWITLRQRRNQLIHEYAEDPERFAEAIVTACRNVEILVATYNRLRIYAMEHMGISESALPSYLGMPRHRHG